ncbi:MFS transporter [bacterium]|nr:MFS transporter [bacterium]
MTHKKTLELAFIKLWVAEIISSLGSSLLSFSLMIWVYKQTNEASSLGYLMFSYLAPQIYFSLFGGHLVDRFNKKSLLLFSDAFQALCSVVLLALFLSQNLSLYSVLPVTFINGFFSGIQHLVFLTSMRSFIPKQKLLQYNGMMSVLQSAPVIVAPLVSLLLLDKIQLSGVIFIDLLTFVLAFLAVLLLPFPKELRKTRGPLSNKFFNEGFLQIRASKELRASLSFFTCINFLNGLAAGLIVAFILEKIGADSPWVSYNTSLTALGLTCGGLLTIKISKRINNPWTPLGWISLCSAIFGRIGVVLSTLPFLIGIGFFLRNLMLPLMNSCNDTIWQTEVPVEKQGIVFGTRRLIAQGLYPIGLFLGPLMASKVGLDILFVGVGALEGLASLVLLRATSLPNQNVIPATKLG